MTIVRSRDTISEKEVYPVALISIREYAERNGLRHDNVRHKCQRGGYRTARKVGRDWLIDSREKNTDHRIRSGIYIKKGSKNDQNNKLLGGDRRV